MATIPLYRATVEGHDVLLADRLRPAHTHWSRLRGLLGTSHLPPGEGLWLMPCDQVHMFGMRYAIDAVFLDAERRVVHVVERLGPGRISPRVPGAASVLELPTGTWARVGAAEGARVEIEGEPATQTAGKEDALAAALCNVFLAALYCLFAAIHLAHGRETGQWATILPIVLQESLLIGLFLTRRRSVATSTRPLDWAVGIGGFFLPFLLRPTELPGPLVWIGQPLQVAGVLLSCVALLFLGRSVGIVAANRGVQTTGLYRMVRHPAYGAHMLCYVGYVAAYPSVRNVLIVVATFALLHSRAVFEERLLLRDPSYRNYLRRTPWRFLPYVY